MSAPLLRTQDWEHRLHVLWAWREWRSVNTADLNKGASYRAVLDGCAVTVRALCNILNVGCDFRDQSPSDGPERLEELLECCWDSGVSKVKALSREDQRCLLEVLYLGNRAVAHPKDGNLDHKVGAQEMTVAVNTVLRWLREKSSDWPELAAVKKDFLTPIS